MRVAVLADCHIDHGVHGRWNTRAWKQACVSICDMDVDLVVLAGDFFQRGNPPGEAVSLAADGLRLLTGTDRGAGVPVVYLQGNHEWAGVDTSRRHRPASSALDGIPGVTVVSEPMAIRVGELWLTALPWPIPGSGAATIDRHEGRMARLADMSCETDGPRLAVAHAAVSGVGHPLARGSELDLAVQTNEWTIPLSDIDMPDAWPHISLGHIHKRQSLSDTCSYVGSLEAFSFADEGQRKGFSLLEWHDTGWDETFVEVGVRKFRTLPASDVIAGDYGSLEEGTLVRVVMESGITRPEIDLGALRDAGMKVVRVIKQRSDTDETASVVMTGSAAVKPVEFLRKWADKKELEEKETGALLRSSQRGLGWDTDTTL